MNEKTYDSNRRQNMRCLGRIHAFPRPMGAFAHGYYTSGCARSHCPASQMWIRSGSATWRRQWHRNRTHPFTTPKQQTCQWERRWMIFFYRPKCSYRFIFFLRVETSAPGLSGYYWYNLHTYTICIWTVKITYPYDPLSFLRHFFRNQSNLVKINIDKTKHHPPNQLWSG